MGINFCGCTLFKFYAHVFIIPCIALGADVDLYFKSVLGKPFTPLVGNEPLWVNVH